MTKVWDRLKRHQSEASHVEVVGDETASTEEKEDVVQPESGEGTEARPGSQVGEKVHEAADKVVDGSKKVAAAVAEKTGEAVSYGKLKMKLHNQRVQRDKFLAALGSRTHDLIRDEQQAVYADEKVQEFIEAVEALETEIKDTEALIEALGQS